MAVRIPQSIWGYGGLMFVAGDSGAIHRRVDSNARLAALIARWSEQSPVEFSGATEATSDGWPYLYLDSRRIPVLYFILGVMLVCLFPYTRWRAKAPEALGSWTPEHWHFFFLGAPFLLLEVHNISKAAVVLGNTWQVNAVIISGILLMILLANLVEARWPKLPSAAVYGGLTVSCLALYALDLAQFAGLPLLQRIVAVGGLAALPILFSGIVFFRSFAASPMKDQALGANLLGSLAGGLLQTVSFLTGVKALLLLVAFLYLVAALLQATFLSRAIEGQDISARRAARSRLLTATGSLTG